MKDKNGKQVSTKSIGCALVILGCGFIFLALVFGVLLGGC